jgi:hypothetical protein
VTMDPRAGGKPRTSIFGFALPMRAFRLGHMQTEKWLGARPEPSQLTTAVAD